MSRPPYHQFRLNKAYRSWFDPGHRWSVLFSDAAGVLILITLKARGYKAAGWRVHFDYYGVR